MAYLVVNKNGDEIVFLGMPERIGVLKPKVT